MRLSRGPFKFVILIMGRSGSTNLVEALNSHSAIYAKGEFLTTKEEYRRLRVARRFLTQSHSEEYSAVGFKTKLKDVPNLEEFARLLREVGTLIILLRRRNVIKQVVSRINSFRLYDTTGDWNLYNEGNRLPPATIDPVSFKETLEEVEKERQELERYVELLDLPTLSLYYEDLLVDQRATLERICSFLGVAYESLQGQAIKHTADDLRQAVSNFEELRLQYIGTRYEEMFDEVLVPVRGS
jgi:LPS sulfotransferase NodH